MNRFNRVSNYIRMSIILASIFCLIVMMIIPTLIVLLLGAIANALFDMMEYK